MHCVEDMEKDSMGMSRSRALGVNQVVGMKDSCSVLMQHYLTHCTVETPRWHFPRQLCHWRSFTAAINGEMDLQMRQ